MHGAKPGQVSHSGQTDPACSAGSRSLWPPEFVANWDSTAYAFTIVYTWICVYLEKTWIFFLIQLSSAYLIFVWPCFTDACTNGTMQPTSCTKLLVWGLELAVCFSGTIQFDQKLFNWVKSRTKIHCEFAIQDGTKAFFYAFTTAKAMETQRNVDFFFNAFSELH